MPLAPTPWPTLLNNSRRTGQGSNPGPASADPAWTYQTGGKITAGAAIGVDGTLYFGAQDKKVYALNPDGTLKWAYAHNYPIYYSSPAIGLDGTIYIGADKVLAINPNGTLKWSYGGVNITGLINATPAIGSDGTIYALSSLVIGPADNKLIALDANGSKKWEYPTGGTGSSSPALGPDGTIYFGCSDGKLYALNPNGTLKWAYSAGGPIKGSPAVDANGNIYIAATSQTPNDNRLIALSPAMAVLWTLASGGEYFSRYAAPAIAADGTIYQGFYGLRAISPAGTVKWQTSTAGNVGYYPGAPAIGSDGTVYFTTEDHKCFAYSSAGVKLWQVDQGYAACPPVIGADGGLYFGSDDKNFYAMRGQSQQPEATTVSFAELAGEPQIEFGLELGIFIYITEDGRWHVRWNGNEKGKRPVTYFYLWGGSISASKIENISPFRFEPGQPDNFSLRRNLRQDTLTFNGVVFWDVDGLDFDVVGDQVLFSLTGQIKDREAFLHPGLIFLGANKINPSGNNFLVAELVTPPPVATPTLFWTNSGPASIQSAALSDAPSPETLVNTTYTAYGLALDSAGQKIYWSDSSSNINTANLDGSNVTPLISGMTFVPYGLGLDLANQVAYCADSRGGDIMRVNLSNGQVDKLVGGLSSPVDVALDLANGKIYWVEYYGGSVGCANLDGTGLTYPVSGLTYPQGVALDAANGILYWADKTSIQRANLDGSNIVLIASLPSALGNMLSRRVAIDTTTSQVYWTDRGTMLIQRIAADAVAGTPETVLSNLPSPALLAPPLY